MPNDPDPIALFLQTPEVLWFFGMALFLAGLWWVNGYRQGFKMHRLIWGQCPKCGHWPCSPLLIGCCRCGFGASPMVFTKDWGAWALVGIAVVAILILSDLIWK